MLWPRTQGWRIWSNVESTSYRRNGLVRNVLVGNVQSCLKLTGQRTCPEHVRDMSWTCLWHWMFCVCWKEDTGHQYGSSMSHWGHFQDWYPGAYSLLYTPLFVYQVLPCTLVSIYTLLDQCQKYLGSNSRYSAFCTGIYRRICMSFKIVPLLAPTTVTHDSDQGQGTGHETQGPIWPHVPR